MRELKNDLVILMKYRVSALNVVLTLIAAFIVAISDKYLGKRHRHEETIIYRSLNTAAANIIGAHIRQALGLPSSLLS